jgi:rhodanese-related sulfurtransferase
MVFLLDIRTREEYNRKHVPGAILIETPPPPLTAGQEQRLWDKLSRLNLPRNTAVAVYCKRGIRARLAQQMLEQLGYTNVSWLGGVETEPLKSLLSR